MKHDDQLKNGAEASGIDEASDCSRVVCDSCGSEASVPSVVLHGALAATLRPLVESQSDLGIVRRVNGPGCG